MKERLGLWAAFAAGVHFVVVVCFVVLQPQVVKSATADRGLIEARRLEERGRFREAGALIDELSSSMYRNSSTAPEALLESARYDLRYRNDPEQALTKLDDLANRYPGNPAAATARRFAVLIRNAGGPGSQPLRMYFKAVGASRTGDQGGALKMIDRVIWQCYSDTLAPYALYQGYVIASRRLQDPVLANKYLGDLQARFPSANVDELADMY